MPLAHSSAAADAAQWLENQLPQNPIFALPPDEEAVPVPLGRPSLLAVRGTDLLIAVNLPPTTAEPALRCELRMVSLLAPSPGSTSNYRPLAPSVPFHVRSLVPSPTGKILAVVGDSEVLVVILPRPGWATHSPMPGVGHAASITSAGGDIAGPELSVSAVPVGRFYHTKGSPRIAKASWHPWGYAASSLLVLTSDGIFREYDISTDPAEPAQTLSFIPGPASQGPTSAGWPDRSVSRARSVTPNVSSVLERFGRFGLDDDDDATTAVSFALSPALECRPRSTEPEQAAEQPAGWRGWGPLEVFALMKNGDVWKICPFMPSKALIPPSYVRHLSTFVKLQMTTSLGRQTDLAVRYVRGLTKQARDTLLGSDRALFDRMSLQESNPSRGEPLELPSGLGNNDEPILLHPPHLPLDPKPLPRGPFLYRPAPVELSEEREPAAADLLSTRLSGGDAAVDVLVIAMDDGRIDVCVADDSIGARWSTKTLKPAPMVSSQLRAQRKRPGRIALSDSESDSENETFTQSRWDGSITRASLQQEVEEGPQDPDPILSVYESIDLGISKQAEDAGFPPSIVRDPLYTDQVYIYHVAGVHALSFAPWGGKFARLWSQAEGPEYTELNSFLHQQVSTSIGWLVATSTSSEMTPSLQAGQPIIGFAVLADVYLSYTMLALTCDLQLVAREIQFRTEDMEPVEERETTSFPPVDAGSDNFSYCSLLNEEGPFTIPEPLASSSLPSHPRLTGGAEFGAELQINDQSLRFLGQVNDTLESEMREIASARNKISGRMRLQDKELDRQLTKASLMESQERELHSRHVQLNQHLERLEHSQSSLVARLDQTLQRLHMAHQPEVSVYERAWFDELHRLARLVGLDNEPSTGRRTASGAFARAPSTALGRGDITQTLKRKVDQLQAQLDLIRPDLEAQQETRARQAATSACDRLGTRQLETIKIALAEQAAVLTEARERTQDLLTRVAAAALKSV